MDDGGETQPGIETGDNPSRNAVPTGERTIPHTYESIVPDNGEAQLIVDATAPPDPYYCPQSDAEKKWIENANGWKNKYISAMEAQLKDRSWLDNLFSSEQDVRDSISWAQNSLPSEWMGRPTQHLTLTGWKDERASHPDHFRMKMIEGYYAKMFEAQKKGDTVEFSRLCQEKNKINESTSDAGEQAKFYGGLVIDGLINAAIARAMSGGGRGIFRIRPRVTTPRAPVNTRPTTVPNTQRPPTPPVTTGEPVNITNGEYLETWNDFVIPGTFTFNGARYMGLNLGLPGRYTSPLGPCQISMFDEIISNPERGKLRLHDSDGRRIEFNRPFNFLPSINPAYPHLELKAPWLKELRLKDGPITKSFRQYADGFYRLEKIEDLNGFSLVLVRSETGVLTHANGPDGLSLSFENDAKSLRKSIVLTGTDGTELQLATYGYDVRGRMISANCTFGMSVHYQWQADRDLLESWHNFTRVSETRFSYDDAGRVVDTQTNGIWNNDRFAYLPGETAYAPGGADVSTQRFRYDAWQNVTEEIDALGGTVAHRYDGSGFRVATINQLGNETSTRYDIRGNIKEFTDAEGRTTTYGWGDDGELQIVIDGAGNRKRYEHDDRSNVIVETDSEGNATRLVRDAKSRVIQLHFANGGIERRTWDEFNRLVSITDAKGRATLFEYDVFGRLITTTDPSGGISRRAYHAAAGGFYTPTEITRPDGVSITRGFDEQGLLSMMRDGEGRAWRYQNGAFGVLEEIIDPKGGKLAFQYDVEGRAISLTNALGRSYRFRRDVAGRVIEETDFDGRTTYYDRDAAGQVFRLLKPDGSKLEYSYDKSGLLTRIQGFNSGGATEDTTRFWYDARGLLTQAENTAALVEFERDRNGRIIAESLNGLRSKSGHDSMGARILLDMTGMGGGITKFIRDPLGVVEKLVLGETSFSITRDVLDREVKRHSASGFTLDQQYDIAGQLVTQRAGSAHSGPRVVTPLGATIASAGTSKTVNCQRLYQYDRAFAPVRVDDGLWGETKLAYDDNGQLASSTSAAGEERFSYSAARNIAGTSSRVPGAGYGGASFRTPPQETWVSTPGGVVQIARGPHGERVRLVHDECGRLIERRVERDGFRPQRWRYGWNIHDQLVSCIDPEEGQWHYRYDPFGRRVAKVKRFSQNERRQAHLMWPNLIGNDDSITWPPSQSVSDKDTSVPSSHAPSVGTAYLWDGDHMVAEAPLHLDGHIAWHKAIRWHHDEDSAHILFAKQLPEGATMPDGTVLSESALFPIICDHLGTPKEMFDIRGDLVWAADHYVWGAVRSARAFGSHAPKPSHDPNPVELDCPWRFPGQYEDRETGLYYNRYRYYDPLTGQYASPDPIGLAAGDRPQGYVANPVRWTDPLGLQARGPDGKFLPANGLPGPGSTFAGRVTSTFRQRGYTVYENVTVRIDGKVVSYADQVAVKGREVLVLESKSGRKTLSSGQQTVQNAIRDGKPIEFSGPNAPNLSGVITPNKPMVLPSGSYIRVTPDSF
ncbi:RHS repeat-associated core domain-containing protein [Phyllobacterium sp. TAF24]|uniref:RHS repeat-associated core domain-containing protein n=1 Tax=Phyllobacterium sp. TAF24 TaxID=3233068 RepID=UPI003F986DDE